MANADKLKQIICNLQNLTDLAVSVKDSELYPVSFFSNAFDLIQKIQNDLHTLEADQVERFTSQMKKHQALILSIHQQVRNMDSIPVTKETVPPVEKETPKPAKPVKPVKKEPLKPVTEKESKPLIATPIIIPEKKTEETVSNEEIKIPEKTQEEKKPEVENSAPHQPLSLNDVIEKNKLSDLRKAFSLNDRFRYRRELFGGREDVMNKTIAELNDLHSLKESLAYLEEELHWDMSDPTVGDFIKKIGIRFL
jgi:hypothetical protein